MKAQSPKLSFTDVAADVGIGILDYPAESVCWGDIDNDNDIDLFIPIVGFAITGPQNLNNLFRNDINSNGMFTDVAVQMGVDEALGNSYSGAWCDVNSDGLLDLYICNISSHISPVQNKLFINNGAYFEDQTAAYNAANNGSNKHCCWGDYDNDGDQDLFLIVDLNNKLLRNDGNYFTDVTQVYGLQQDVSTMKSATWVDFDNDGDLDLYLVFFSYENRLYENFISDNNTFVENAGHYAIQDTGGGSYSAIWFDFDNDKDLDLFHSCRINRQFPASYGESTLYRNDINTIDRFTNVNAETGIGFDLLSTIGTASDFDQDGDLDIYLGCSTEFNRFYRNDYNQTGQFTEIAGNLNLVDTLISNAISHGDYDNDGDPDIIVVKRQDQPARLYRNNLNSPNYLKIRLTDKNGRFNRFGSRAYVYFAGTDSLAGMRVVDGGGNGGSSQSEYDLHFGVAPDQPYDIEVVFTTRTNGQNHIFNKYNRPQLGSVIPSQINHFLEVRDTVVTVTSVKRDPKPSVLKTFRLHQNYPNPFNSETTIPVQLGKKYQVTLIIFGINGEEISRLVDQELTIGHYEFRWDGKNSEGVKTGSGVYFCSIFLNGRLQNVIKLLQAK